METVERDYSPRGVRFFYIYKSLAHPEMNGYVAPFTLEERLRHVAEAQLKIGSRFHWLCDSMDNALKHALGDAPNSEFLVDPEGRIVVARPWSEPASLREDLARLLGKVDPPTSVESLGMKPLKAPKTAATGVVPRLKLPPGMVPVRVQPLLAEGGEPFYVKLRAEIQPEYLQSDRGQLYLGFFLDPLYQVHWNNRATPMRFEIECPDGTTVNPTASEGPPVAADADADPREFLVEVSGKNSAPLRLTIHYFACDDAETFCKPVTQQYEIALERDRDGGSRRAGGAGGATAKRPLAGMGRGGPPRFPGLGPPAAAADQPRAANPDAERREAMLRRAVEFFHRHDADRDGQLQKQEWPDVRQPLADADADADDAITLPELLNWLRQRTERGTP